MHRHTPTVTLLNPSMGLVTVFATSCLDCDRSTLHRHPVFPVAITPALLNLGMS